MKRTDFSFQSEDKLEIYACKWESERVNNVKAVVQISHGMAEHILRYQHFAQFLVDQGFIVYGNDHRGHGQTVKNGGEVGYFADEAGFHKVVDDVFKLTTIIKQNHPDLPIILFGHSMGSFIARRYMQIYGDNVQATILSGTGGDPRLLGKIGLAIAEIECRKNGPKEKSPLLASLSFGNFNRQFAPNRTHFDWLSSLDDEVDSYIADPLCGGIFTAGFFRDIFKGIALINEKREIKLIRKDLPILFISGDRDPVGNNGKGIWQAARTMSKCGLENVTVKLYDGARHEILNEANSEQVFHDILKWIEKNLK